MTKASIEGQKVLVIGGGPSGTAVLRSFKSAQDKGEAIPEVVCYEKQSALGGQWNYSWRTGLDENNETVASSMYRYLWSNGPKECLEFADYTFEEHFGKAIPSYPPREVLADYIHGRIKKSNIDDWIKLNTAVQNCVYDQSKEKFIVTSRTFVDSKGQKLKPPTEETVEFDYVFCCTGHFHVPNVPYFPGFEKFEGRVLHAHDFKDAREFENSRILLIGSSYSAEDISSQCYKYGCKDITLSYRTNPMTFKWPEGFETKPLLERVEGKTCFFKDGSSKDIDAIILCTGYVHHFPFMADDLTLRTDNRLWIDNTYEGIFFNGNPKLMYIGMQDQWYTFNMFDAQAWFARDYVLGRITLPSKEVQKQEFDEQRAKELKLEGDEENIRFQAAYVEKLMAATDYPGFEIQKTIKEFLAWEHYKHEDIMTFRDKAHTSALTGKTAPKHHTPWIDALDDSMACYLQTE
eukprot:Awhi_evm1s10854